MGLVCEAIEQRGIPTVTVAMEEGVAAPRILRVPFPYNLPMGKHGHTEGHRRVALAALRLIWELDGPAEAEL